MRPVHRLVPASRYLHNSVSQKVRCHMIRRLIEAPDVTLVQETTFAIDVQGRYVCNTWDEAIGTIGNGGVALHAGGIGARMFRAHCAEKNFPQRGEARRRLFLHAGHLLLSPARPKSFHNWPRARRAR